MSPKPSFPATNRLAVFPPSSLPEFDSALQGSFERRQFTPGECLFREKDPPDGLYLVRQGRVALEMAGTEDGTIKVATCGPGMLVGAGATVSGQPREYTARALTTVVADFVAREVIMARMHSYMPFALQISQLLAAEIARMNQLGLRLRSRKTG